MEKRYTIDTIEARSISDSRGKPTIELEMHGGGHTVTAAVPSGKSAGSREALEKRDADGDGVQDAIAGIHDIITPALVGKEFGSTDEVDEVMLELDGTEDKSNLGANATLAVSFAAAKLFAAQAGQPLWKFIAETQGFTPSYPRLYMNMLNGGAHADFCMPFQEYIAVVGDDEAKPSDTYALAQDLFTKIGERVKDEFGEVKMGDEGGYSPTCKTLEQPFELLDEQTKDVQDKTFLAIDAAASEFYCDGTYTMLEKDYDRAGMLDVYATLVEQFPLRSIEDAFVENDVEGFTAIQERLGGRAKMVGDDYTVTNPKILKDRIEHNSGNALIIKPNQIGTLKETFETVRIAYEAGWVCVASHRSGETLDTTIADIAVGIGAYGLKAGAPSQRERAVKYERLLEIEREM